MTLLFPNRSRSFDDVRKVVRFLGYDGMFEIRFFVEAAALAKTSAELSEARSMRPAPTSRKPRRYSTTASTERAIRSRLRTWVSLQSPRAALRGLSMNTRTSMRKITLQKAFRLPGMENAHAPGEFDVQIYEQPLDVMWGYHRTMTFVDIRRCYRGAQRDRSCA